jgi:branched-subunit amino acid ABC-type transport system permease component
MSAFANILAGGVFHAAVLFLVAAGLQLVFGVQKIVNLACGSFTRSARISALHSSVTRRSMACRRG